MRLLISIIFFAISQPSFGNLSLVARCSEVVDHTGPFCGSLALPRSNALSEKIMIKKGQPINSDLYVWSKDSSAQVNGTILFKDGSNSQIWAKTQSKGNVTWAAFSDGEAFSNTDSELRIITTAKSNPKAQIEASLEKKSNRLTLTYRSGSLLEDRCQVTFLCESQL